MNHLESTHPQRCPAVYRLGITEAEFRSDASSNGTPRRGRVCKRCLASLAKRDREFRAKARRHLVMGHGRRFDDEQRRAVFVDGKTDWRDAARAIAREEGRIQ